MEHNTDYTDAAGIAAGFASWTTVNSSLFDLAGNQLKTPNLSSIQWDWQSQIGSISYPDPQDATATVSEYYVYAPGGGQRVRKIRETVSAQGLITKLAITDYLGNTERRSDYVQADPAISIGYDGETVSNAVAQKDYSELRVRLGHAQSARLLSGRLSADGPDNQCKSYFDLSNQTDSVQMELDETGRLSNYQAYYPFGGTAFSADSKDDIGLGLKHYQYSGQEKDASGLYYYGYRYYDSSAFRWTRPDPAGAAGSGFNWYAMVSNNPVTHRDVMGLVKKPSYYRILRHLAQRRARYRGFHRRYMTPVTPQQSTAVAVFGAFPVIGLVMVAIGMAVTMTSVIRPNNLPTGLAIFGGGVLMILAGMQAQRIAAANAYSVWDSTARVDITERRKISPKAVADWAYREKYISENWMPFGSGLELADWLVDGYRIYLREVAEYNIAARAERLGEARRRKRRKKDQLKKRAKLKKSTYIAQGNLADFGQGLDLVGSSNNNSDNKNKNKNDNNTNNENREDDDIAEQENREYRPTGLAPRQHFHVPDLAQFLGAEVNMVAEPPSVSVFMHGYSNVEEALHEWYGVTIELRSGSHAWGMYQRRRPGQQAQYIAPFQPKQKEGYKASSDRRRTGNIPRGTLSAIINEVHNFVHYERRPEAE